MGIYSIAYSVLLFLGIQGGIFFRLGGGGENGYGSFFFSLFSKRPMVNTLVALLFCQLMIKRWSVRIAVS